MLLHVTDTGKSTHLKQTLPTNGLSVKPTEGNKSNPP